VWEVKKRTESPSDAGNFTVLGKDVRFKGVVHFEGTVQLDSCFEGEIHTTGILVVGEHVVIRGTLTVGTLISGGKIQGQVTATDKVQLLKSAVHIGNIQSPAFLIEAGAYFKGHVDMGKNPWEEESLQQVDTGQNRLPPRHELVRGR
jgi:cytoskeletal protein CcmA (bactofilin family)